MNVTFDAVAAAAGRSSLVSGWHRGLWVIPGAGDMMFEAGTVAVRHDEQDVDHCLQAMRLDTQLAWSRRAITAASGAGFGPKAREAGGRGWKGGERARVWSVGNRGQAGCVVVVVPCTYCELSNAGRVAGFGSRNDPVTLSACDGQPTRSGRLAWLSSIRNVAANWRVRPPPSLAIACRSACCIRHGAPAESDEEDG
nr:hypothetical protein CFP56_21860 [Quercus suber]